MVSLRIRGGGPFEDAEVGPNGFSISFDTNSGIPTTGLTRVVWAKSIGLVEPEQIFVQLRVSGGDDDWKGALNSWDHFFLGHPSSPPPNFLPTIKMK